LTEQEFADSISCRFPYNEKSAAVSLILQGWSISSNAAFCILHEICRLPQSVYVESATQKALVEQWTSAGSHPLQSLLLQCANALIDSKPIAWQGAVRIMNEVRGHEGQYAALSIAYFAGDFSTSEGDDALEETNNDIRQQWDGV
jgi:hypothetical protein